MGFVPRITVFFAAIAGGAWLWTVASPVLSPALDAQYASPAQAFTPGRHEELLRGTTTPSIPETATTSAPEVL